MVSEVLAVGVLKEGDIHQTDGCTQAAALAEKFRDKRPHTAPRHKKQPTSPHRPAGHFHTTAPPRHQKDAAGLSLCLSRH